MPADAHLLAVAGAEVRFGGVAALSGADFAVAEGSITSLIGPNGAGKTTLFNAVSGFAPLSGGSIKLSGRELYGLPPYARARLGLARTFQNLEVFGQMTVAENVQTGAYRLARSSALDAVLRTPRHRRAERESLELARELLDFVGLADKRDLIASELSFGHQRALELARAPASRPKLLLLDEPAAGLNIRETRELTGLIGRIRDERGVTVALVEHDMDLVMRVSDVVTVLFFGKTLVAGPPAKVQKHPDVVRAYLGGEE